MALPELCGDVFLMEVSLDYEAGNTSDKHKSALGYVPCHDFRLIHSQPVTAEDSGF